MPALALLAAAGGASSALLYIATLAALPGVLAFVLLVPLPLLLVGLSRQQGWTGAALAGGIGTLAVGLAAGPWAAGNYAVTEAVPAFFLARQGTLHRSHGDGQVEWYPIGRLLVWLSLYAGAVLLAAMLYFTAFAGGLESELERAVAALFRDVGVQLSPEAERLINAFVDIMPGLAASTWLLVTAGNASLAQSLLERFRWNFRPAPELASLVLPAWLGAAVALSAAAGLLVPGSIGFAGRNLCFILATPYFFGGVACLHALARRGGASRHLLTLFYVALVLAIVVLSWLAIMGIAVLGFIDQAAGLRQRLTRRGGPPQGS